MIGATDTLSTWSSQPLGVGPMSLSVASTMKGWNEECDGRCVPLAVRVEAGVFSGAWEPTPAEQGMFSSRPAATWY